MAITILNNAQVLAPAHNPIYWLLNSTNKAQNGFRYVVTVIDDDTSEELGVYRLKPQPVTLYGEVDVAKLLASSLKTDFQAGASWITNGKQLLNYKLKIDQEWFVNFGFSDYGFAGQANWPDFLDPIVNPNGFSRTQLIMNSAPTFVVGDVINVKQTPSANFRPELEGIQTVLDVYLSGGVWYVVLELLWIGSGGTSAGVTTFADGKKTLVTGIETSVVQAFKGAFRFMQFNAFNPFEYINDTANKQFLTTLPEGVRVSAQRPTWLQVYTNDDIDYYLVWTIDGVQYRYQIQAQEDGISIVNITPDEFLFEQVLIDGIWETWGGFFTLTADSYTIQLQDVDGVPKSELRTVSVYQECDFHDTYNVCFFDRLGSWITIPFNKGAYMTQQIERETARKKYGRYSGGKWGYETFERGEEVYNIEEGIVYNVNSGQLSQLESQYYRELISTAQAFVSIGQRLDMPFTLNRYANIFNYATGQAPTLAAFETQIGFPLINGAKFGDTIVFDNVGYELAESLFENAGLTGFLKCSVGIFNKFVFENNTIEKVYLTQDFTSANQVFKLNNITHLFVENGISLSDVMFSENNLQYINIRSVLNIGSTTGDNNIFTNNTGNNITVIAPAIHETSNSGGLEGDLDYLDDNNTVDFVWDGDEVPTWISDPIFNPILLLDWQAIVIENESNNLHLKRTARDRKLSLSFRMATQDNINA
jgi:hypothetical protein